MAEDETIETVTPSTGAVEITQVGAMQGAPGYGQSAQGDAPEPAQYVVQVMEEFEDGAESGLWTGWRDAAMVEVAPRTKMVTVLRRAAEILQQQGDLPADGTRMRVTPADEVTEVPVGLKPRDPELVIGGGS
jgi:hypothetical protein